MQTCMKKVKVAIFLAFIHRFQKNDQKKFWTKNAENFHNALIFFENFTNSKNKVRTQIFPKIGKNYFYKQMHIYSGSANDIKQKKVSQLINFVS